MRPARHARWATWTLIGAGLLLLVPACGSDDDDDSADTTEPQRTTTTESSTTTLAAEGPIEWVSVVQGIYQRNFDLLANPDPAHVGDLYAESCECWDRYFGTVQHLASVDQHAEGQPTSVLFVKHEQTDPDTGFVDLTIKVRAEPLQLVTADGEVEQDLPVGDDAESCLSVALLRDGPGDTYRVHDELPLNECPPGS